MDTLNLYANMREIFGQVVRQAERFSPVFRDGSARVDWLEDGINQAFDSWRAQLTMAWLLSDATHTMALSDFALQTPAEADATIQARLEFFGLLGAGQTLAVREAAMVERDRSKLLALWRADMSDPAFPVGARLNAVSVAMDAARDEVLALIPTTGDVTTIKWVSVGGIRRREGKTISEMGLNAVPVADRLDTLATEIRATVPVR